MSDKIKFKCDFLRIGACIFNLVVISNMVATDFLEIQGVAEKVIFRNTENGYTIVDVKSEEQTVTAVGTMPWVSVGENLQLFGKWERHPDFGMQFAVQECKSSMPLTCAAIVRYISSGIVEGIGVRTAEKLVDKFKEETINVIKESPLEMCAIRGITEKKAHKISEQLNKITEMRSINEHLAKYGILPSETIKIHKLLGKDAIKQIESDPYVLCFDDIGVDFQKADAIAKDLEILEQTPLRIQSGILYILKHNMNNGHTCLPARKLVPVAAEFLSVEPGEVEDNIKDMSANDKLISEEINQEEFLFLPEMYSSETYCALRIKMLLKFTPKCIEDILGKIELQEKKNKIKYAELQKRAVEIASSKGMLVLTGGPGTGKTTTLKAIINILEANGEKIFLCAPTGRAAQRMGEITGREAKTIHRMLEVSWDMDDNPVFNKNEKNLLKCDALVIDEMSMVDLTLFESVLKAVPMGCRLIIVGDFDQLMSVGAGNVLHDLISSCVIPVVQLKEIFRQSGQSLIVMNAHKIVGGEMPELKVKNNDFFFLPIYNSVQIKEAVVDLCKRRLPNSYGYSPIYDIQVIAPGKRGILGTESLNASIQNVLNPKTFEKKEISINGKLFREGDKVMQTKNNYKIYWEKENSERGEGIYNGDIGVIAEIESGSSLMAVKYGDRVAIYDFEDCADLDLAYAITVHKSQGSEFEAVIIPIFGGNPKLYYRNLLYTAVTRAKSRLIMLGSEFSVEKMINNDARSKRYSGLGHFLKQ